MTEHMMNIDPSQLNDAARLRALADGELTPEQAGDVAGDRDRLEFEHALREGVGRVMGDESVRAPEALRASVIQMFRDEATDNASSDAAVQEPALVTSPMGDTTDRSFWSGAGRYLSLAAVLALVITLVGVGVTQTFSTPPVSPFTIERASDVRTFVPEAHQYSTSCTPGEFEEKFVTKNIDDAVSFTDEVLAGVPEDLAAKLRRFVGNGFTFAGIGQCRVPGDGNSVHAYFVPEGGGEAVSVFIQAADPNEIAGMCERHCFGVDCEKDPGEAKNLVVWKCSGYLHYIYSPDATLTERARVAFSAPLKTASLMP